MHYYSWELLRFVDISPHEIWNRGKVKEIVDQSFPTILLSTRLILNLSLRWRRTFVIGGFDGRKLEAIRSLCAASKGDAWLNRKRILFVVCGARWQDSIGRERWRDSLRFSADHGLYVSTRWEKNVSLTVMGVNIAPKYPAAWTTFRLSRLEPWTASRTAVMKRVTEYISPDSTMIFVVYSYRRICSCLRLESAIIL